MTPPGGIKRYPTVISEEPLFFASRGIVKLQLAGSNRTLAVISKLQDFTEKKMVILFQKCFVIGLYRKT
jgi:hypothetical protein